MIIAICGKKRTGKDTIAAVLERNYAFALCKFAQQLKNGLCSFFNFTLEQLEGPEKDAIDPRWGISPRHAMQWMGTDIMQFQIHSLLPGIGRNFWAKQLASQIEASGDATRIVISDMRFFHEYLYLKERFGARFVTMRVRRDAAEKGGAEDGHASEVDCDNIPADYTIFNNGSIESLSEMVGDMMNQCVASAELSSLSNQYPVSVDTASKT